MARSAASARSSMLMAGVITTIAATNLYIRNTRRSWSRAIVRACGTRDVPLTRRGGGRAMTRRTVQRVVTVGLIAATIGVAALVGARAWAQGPRGMHAGMMKRMISAALDE